MEGINRALTDNYVSETYDRCYSKIGDKDVPCVFISYQRDDEWYAKNVANYIVSRQIDIYFDLEDKDLKQKNQNSNPKGVTEAIKKGLNKSEYMLVIVSPNTIKSPWVPFEVGYAYDKKADNMKILRHKGIAKETMPDYMKVKELLHGTLSLNRFLDSIRKNHFIYENLLKKGQEIKTFSEYNDNPLKTYLDNE